MWSLCMRIERQGNAMDSLKVHKELVYVPCLAALHGCT